MKPLMFTLVCIATTAWAAPPAVGDKVSNFELKSLAGDSVTLQSLLADGPAVIVVLRGYPGYQCPACSRQFGEFSAKANEFKKQGKSLIFIYPGDVNDLDAKAKEFLNGKAVPDAAEFLLDPNYSFTNAWGLRWDAVRETAYPSTFVIGTDGVVKSATVSKTHGGRTKAIDYLN